MTPTPSTCPQCGSPLQAGVLGGLCPACVRRVAMFGTESVVDPDATYHMPVPAALLTEQPGDVIGRYRLVEVLGEGGFGVVWRAEQTEPIRRAVALKVIKPGMDSREIIARFEAERQSLAMMDHPNIAAVLDAGSTANGRPFFAMELVQGEPVTEYCDRRRLGIRERVELFIPVCQAVQHAHQKAILHRDLKPSNILVEEHDGKPVPKVIDFGIAKALGTSVDAVLQGSLLQTQEGCVIGTPQYMSPEQAGGSGDMDTRSDIYTLGAILYELLTGDTPLPRERLRKAAFDEILRMVREADPVRPSSRVLPLTEATRHMATTRHTEPSRLNRTLRGDLDWITLKALEKERERRYSSAATLALELERYLKNEPVEAGPPGAMYRLKKLARRNKAAFAVVTAIAASLVIGFLAVAWAFMREKDTREREAAQRSIAEQALADLKSTAPTFHAQAELLLDQADFTGALEKIGYAIQLDGDHADYRLFRAHLTQAMQDLGGAAEEYRRVLSLRPDDQTAKSNLALCERLLKENGAAPTLRHDLQKQLLLALRSQGRLVEAGPLNKIFDADIAIAEAALRARLRAYEGQPGWNEKRVSRLPDGTFRLDLSHLKIGDLTVLKDQPLAELNLAQDVLADHRAMDLRGLPGLPLRDLNLSGADVADLTPLRGMPLEQLDLSLTSVADLAALAGMKLKKLILADTLVANLKPLTGMPLEHLDCDRVPDVNDLSPLKGAPLAWLGLWRTSVNDLTPLAGMPLKHLNLRETQVVSLEPLKTCAALEDLDISGTPVGDLTPLAKLKLQRLLCGWSKVSDLEPLRSMPLRFIDLQGVVMRNTQSLMASTTLEEIVLPASLRDGRSFLGIPSLKRISKRLSGNRPAQTKEEYTKELAGVAPAPTAGAKSLSPAEELALRLIIPQVSIHSMPLDQVLEHLRAKSVELDPEKRGVQIVVDPGVPPAVLQAPVKLSKANYSVLHVLNEITWTKCEVIAKGRTFLILPREP